MKSADLTGHGFTNTVTTEGDLFEAGSHQLMTQLMAACVHPAAPSYSKQLYESDFLLLLRIVNSAGHLRH